MGNAGVMSHISLSLQPATAELSTLRRSLRKFFSTMDEPVDDWLLIATELMTNAIAAAPAAMAIEVEVEVKPNRIDLRVVDMGHGFELDPKASVPASDERGRGLMMVSALADDFTVSVENGRTIATASRSRALDDRRRERE